VPPENQRLLLPGNDDAASISGIGTFLGCIVALEQGGKTQVLVPGLLDKKNRGKMVASFYQAKGGISLFIRANFWRSINILKRTFFSTKITNTFYTLF
jgi:hypothetical protein